MHLDDEQIQRLLHGELAQRDEPLIRGHLGVCQECRLKLDDAEQEESWVSQRLRRLDHRQPQVGVESVLAARRARPPARWRWAAGFILLFAAAGAAYAAPGSPLPRMLGRLIGLFSPAHQGTQRRTASPGVGASPAGIAVAPGDRLTIVFEGDQSKNTAVVSLTDSADVIVRARGGTTTFTSDTDGLSIGHQGNPARFQVLIPRKAPFVELLAGRRRVLLKADSRIITQARRDPRGRYLIRLSSQGP